MEAERIKYMLKSYLRTRLFKIERYILCIVEKDQTALLSDGEIQYAWSLYEGKKNLFSQQFLNKIPSGLNPFETESQTLEDRMITKPNENEFVFVRFLKDYEQYALNIDMEIKI
jgi:GINS complex subunit 4